MSNNRRDTAISIHLTRRNVNNFYFLIAMIKLIFLSGPCKTAKSEKRPLPRGRGRKASVFGIGPQLTLQLFAYLSQFVKSGRLFPGFVDKILDFERQRIIIFLHFGTVKSHFHHPKIVCPVKSRVRLKFQPEKTGAETEKDPVLFRDALFWLIFHKMQYRLERERNNGKRGIQRLRPNSDCCQH